MTKQTKNSSAKDLWLVLRVRAGSRSAFGELVERHQPGLRRYLTQLTGGDRFRADDLAQEAFMKAYSAIGQFKSSGSFRAWLYRIAYRQFLDSCRSAKPFDELTDRTKQAGYELSADVALLQNALSCLDDTERSVILLSAVEQLSHGQIAEVADMPLGTVKTVVARAKAKLRNHLKQEEL